MNPIMICVRQKCNKTHFRNDGFASDFDGRKPSVIDETVYGNATAERKILKSD